VREPAHTPKLGVAASIASESMPEPIEKPYPGIGDSFRNSHRAKIYSLDCAVMLAATTVDPCSRARRHGKVRSKRRLALPICWLSCWLRQPERRYRRRPNQQSQAEAALGHPAHMPCQPRRHSTPFPDKIQAANRPQRRSIKQGRVPRPARKGSSPRPLCAGQQQGRRQVIKRFDRPRWPTPRPGASKIQGAQLPAPGVAADRTQS